MPQRKRNFPLIVCGTLGDNSNILTQVASDPTAVTMEIAEQNFVVASASKNSVVPLKLDDKMRCLGGLSTGAVNEQ